MEFIDNLKESISTKLGELKSLARENGGSFKAMMRMPQETPTRHIQEVEVFFKMDGEDLLFCPSEDGDINLNLDYLSGTLIEQESIIAHVHKMGTGWYIDREWDWNKSKWTE